MHDTICMCVLNFRNKEACSNSTVFQLWICIRETLNEDPTTCQSEFRNQFSECSEFGLSDDQFNDRGKIRASLSMRDRQYWKHSLKSGIHRKQNIYITTFSRGNWKALPKGEKQKHTLSFCQECREKYYHLQKAFPCQPLFSFPSPTTTTVTLLSTTTTERELTSAVLTDLNGTYVQRFGHTFVDSLVQNCKDVDMKRTKTEKKRDHRNLLKRCRDKVNEQLAENVALHTLAEDELLARYQRKCLAQSFEKPPALKKNPNPSPLQVLIYKLTKKMCCMT